MAAGTPLANAFVRVHLDGSQVQSQLHQILNGATPPTVQINTQVNHQQLQQQLNNAGAGAGASGRQLGGVLGANVAAGIAGAGVGIALAKVFSTGIGEQKDYEAGLARLQSGLKSTGGAAGISADQMEALASKIQDYSGQTDDSIVATEQLLLTFTNIRNVAGKNNDIFTQTTKIAADMAARLGGDASSAAIQLGKALNDPIKGITALTRVGVSFTQQQKDQINTLVKSGDTLSAQKVILAELNKEFGGSAKAVGDSLPGQIEKAKRSFEDLSQSVVAAVEPLISGLAPAIRDLAKIIGPILETAVKTTVDVFKDLVGAGEAVYKFFEHNKGLAAAFATVITVALLPALGALVAAIGRQLLLALLNVGIAFSRLLVGLTSINPVVLGVAAAIGTAITVFEAFSDHQKTAKITVDDLTDALVQQAKTGGDAARNLLLKTLQGTDIGSKGEDVLQYLQRYKINVADVYKALREGNAGALQISKDNPLLRAIAIDPSVAGKTKERLGNLFIDLEGKFGQATDKAKSELQALAEKSTGAGRAAKGAASDIQKLHDANVGFHKATDIANKALSSQIDLLAGVANQSKITGDQLLENTRSAVFAIAQEATNIGELQRRGLDPKTIKALVDKGPEYVAAANSLQDEQLAEWSTSYQQGLQAHWDVATAETKLGADKVSKAALAKLNAAQANAYTDSLVTPARSALGQIASITNRAGKDIPDGLADKLLDGRGRVLAAAIATFPAPVQKAINQAINNAQFGGAGTGHGFGAGLDSATPFALTKAQALRLGINAELQKVLTKLGILVTTDDQASGKIAVIRGEVVDLTQLLANNHIGVASDNRLIHDARVQADGGIYRNKVPGGVYQWAEAGGESFIPHDPSKRSRSLSLWAETGKILGVPGMADGGVVRDAVGDIQVALSPVADSLGNIIGQAKSMAQAAAAAAAAAVSGALAGPGQSFNMIIDFMRNAGIGFSTALPGLDRGGHSYHEAGEAVDFSGGDMTAMANFWHGYAPYLLELIHSPSWYVKNGADVGPGFYGSDIVAQHFNHVHVAASLAAMKYLTGTHDSGGLLRTGSAAVNQSGATEAVLTNAQWNLLKSLVSVAGVQKATAGDIRSAQNAISVAVKEGNGPLQQKIEASLRKAEGALFGTSLAATADGKVTAAEFGRVAQSAKAVTDLTAQLVKANTVNTKLVTSLADFAQKQTEFRDSLQSTISQGAGFTDLLGHAGTTGDLKTLLSGKLADVRAFASKVVALKRQGWPDIIIRDVASAGLGLGAQYADLLLGASKTDRASIASLTGQLSSTELGAANSITQLTQGRAGLTRPAALAALNAALYKPGANQAYWLGQAELRQRTYDKGGWLMPGTTLAHNFTGKPEPVGSVGGRSAPLVGVIHVTSSVELEAKLRQAQFLETYGGTL